MSVQILSYTNHKAGQYEETQPIQPEHGQYNLANTDFIISIFTSICKNRNDLINIGASFLFLLPYVRIEMT